MKLITYPPAASSDVLDLSLSVLSGDSVSAGQPVAIAAGKVSTLANANKLLSTNNGLSSAVTNICRLSNTKAVVNAGTFHVVNYSGETITSIGAAQSISFNYTGSFLMCRLSDTLIGYIASEGTGSSAEAGYLTVSGNTITKTAYQYLTPTPYIYNVLAIDGIKTADHLFIATIGSGSSSSSNTVWIFKWDLAGGNFASVAKSMGSHGSSVEGAAVKFLDGETLVCSLWAGNTSYGYQGFNVQAEFKLMALSNTSYLQVYNSQTVLSPYFPEEQKSKLSINFYDGLTMFARPDAAPIYVVRNANKFGIALDNAGKVRVKGKVTNMSGLTPGAYYFVSNGEFRESYAKTSNVLGQALSATDFLIF